MPRMGRTIIAIGQAKNDGKSTRSKKRNTNECNRQAAAQCVTCCVRRRFIPMQAWDTDGTLLMETCKPDRPPPKSRKAFAPTSVLFLLQSHFITHSILHIQFHNSTDDVRKSKTSVKRTSRATRIAYANPVLFATGEHFIIVMKISKVAVDSLLKKWIHEQFCISAFVFMAKAKFLVLLKDQSSNLQPYEKWYFGKIMKNGAFFVFTTCSESL
jgi:hypothetical protein